MGGVHDGVARAARLSQSVRFPLCLLTLVVAGGCGRTALGLAEPAVDGGADGPADGGADGPADTPPEALFDSPAEVALDGPLPGADVPSAPVCAPRDEICNGVDDDCDGKIDEDQTPVPCPGGGHRYCVAGRWSECPRRCQTCVPGSRRVCFISYCTYWGRQTCADDGMSWSRCAEQEAPPECIGIARSKKDSPELERCCIDNGYCCLDEFDLDGDGNRTEMLGRCDAVTCAP